MQVEYIPGTTILRSFESASAFSYIEPLLAATGGLSLSQICAITGLEGSTIQNWVKRGWVLKPTMKKYGEIQVSRIIIISSLRDSMQMEQITRLLSYVNGSVEDPSDDIIKESQLFNYLCEIVHRFEVSDGISVEKVGRLVGSVTKGYVGPAEDSRERLCKSLTVMAMMFMSGWLKREADTFLGTFL